MRSSTPKMLHPVCGRAMVAWPILAAREAGAGRVAAIVSPGMDLSAGLPEGVETVEQPEPDGTGGAIRAALALIEASETVLVLSGDVPLLSAATIAGLLEAHAASPAAATMLTIELDDPASYGRVVRTGSGDVERVVEAKAAGDADPGQLAIREINAGTYAFDAAPLAAALAGLSNDNAQGEYYLPDVFPALREAGHTVAAHLADDLAVTMGVNNRVDLAAVEAEARRRLLEAHMLAGVTVVDPGSTWVDAGVEIARRRPDRARHQPARRHPRRRPRRGRPDDHARSTAPSASSPPSSTPTWSSARSATAARSAPSPTCAPAPCSTPAPRRAPSSRSRTPTSARTPRSRTSPTSATPTSAAAATSAPARSPPTTTDSSKNRTVIGVDVRIGVDTMLIAPVEVGDSAYTGAGAVIKDDVPEGALAVSENAQRNIDGYAAAKAAKMREEQSQ